MRTPANIAGHPIHPMIVPIPIGLWIFSFACDLMYALGSHNPVWKTVALYSMMGGLIGGLIAALPGLIDLLSLPSGPKRTALAHMGINLTIVALFAVNAWMRVRAGDAAAPSNTPVWLSAVAIALLLVSGWLGRQARLRGRCRSQYRGIEERPRGTRASCIGSPQSATKHDAAARALSIARQRISCGLRLERSAGDWSRPAYQMRLN